MWGLCYGLHRDSWARPRYVPVNFATRALAVQPILYSEVRRNHFETFEHFG